MNRTEATTAKLTLMDGTELISAKFKLLLKTAGDKNLASCDVRLAIILLLKYYNAEMGYAYPGRKRLVDDLGVNWRSVARSATFARSNNRSAARTIGISTILPSIENTPRPSP